MEFRRSLGVSAIVRLTRDALRHQAGEVGMIVGQAPNGRGRYSVMFPGSPFALSLAADDVELVQGLRPDVDRWWSPTFDVWAALRERVRTDQPPVA